MLRNIIYISSFTALIVFAVACGSGSSNAGKAVETSNTNIEVYYTCTMHPEVHKDKPGECPKCGMTLVKKEVAKADSAHVHQHSDTMQMK